MPDMTKVHRGQVRWFVSNESVVPVPMVPSHTLIYHDKHGCDKRHVEYDLKTLLFHNLLTTVTDDYTLGICSYLQT